MNSLQLGLTGAAAGTALACAASWWKFSSDVKRARASVKGKSELFQSRFGVMEYAVAGSGSPIIMVHGIGGGFDHGLDMGKPLIDAGWRVIAPSRFGYLRSELPEDASYENQADAFVELLDELGIGRAPIMGTSAGAMPAIQFAIRHPDRCSGLVLLVPTAYNPNRKPPEPMSPLAQMIIEFCLKSDLLFWAMLVIAENAMIRTILATDIEVVRNASPAEQARVRNILWSILPICERFDGIMHDVKFAATRENLKPMALEKIVAPTLAISMEDDRFETMDVARYIAENVSGAVLRSYPKGGHVWVGLDDEIYTCISDFLKRQQSVNT